MPRHGRAGFASAHFQAPAVPWYSSGRTMKRIAPIIALLWLTGCASYHVQRGAAIGALSGAALGALTGELISDPKVWGSEKTAGGGDITLPQGGSILACAGIGLLTGAIVGAMVGHQRDDGFEEKAPPPPPPSTEPAAHLEQQLPARLTKF